MNNQATIDYQRSAAYWRRVAEANASRPDFAVGLNDDVPEGAHRFCREGQLRYFVENIGPFAKDADILDLGCGPATFSLAVAAEARSVLGIDLAQPFIEAAQEEAHQRGLTNTTFEVGELVSFEPTHSYDLVLLGSVLQYIGDPELAPLLARIFSALKPGGRVYVRVSVAAKNRWHKEGAYPVVYRKVEEYLRAFESAGFEVERSDPDPFYSFGDLFRGYFIALRWMTFGLSKRWPGLQNALLRALLRLRPITLDGPVRSIYHFDIPVPHLRAQQLCFCKPESLP